MTPIEFHCRTPEETFLLGEKISKHLRAGDIILLYGDLGSGKTTFVQGVCRGLELPKEFPVRSPTFTLINEYQAKHMINHIDLYRLESMEEIENLGLEEYLFGDGITLVEWSEKLKVPRSIKPSVRSGSISPPKNSKEVSTNELNPFQVNSYLEIEIILKSDELRNINIVPINLGERNWPNSALQ